MKVSSNKVLIALVIVVAVYLSACKKEGCTDPEAINYSEKAKKDDGSCIYDKNKFLAEMLNDIGTYIILPRYDKANIIFTELNTSVLEFSTDLSVEKLLVAQNKLREAELAWQKCATFEFGPAEEVSLRAHVNTFPTDTALIENKITSGSYDMSSFLAVGYKGLPALDYLLNYGTNQDIVSKFQTSSNRLNFLKDASARLKTDLAGVNQKWIASNGNYINTFVSSLGSDVSSSLSLLVNQFNLDYELTKNAKIGIPLGKQTLGTPYPSQCESYYGGTSSALANESLKGLFNLYLGVTESGEDKKGFKDYLVELKNQALSETISSQFETAINKMQAVPDPMANTIQNNSSIVDVAYEEIKKLVVLIKTDMTTEMEVSITYKDGDGD